jgi:hypothetical protein
MEGWGRRIVILAVVGFLAYKYWNRSGAQKSPTSGASTSSAFWGCEQRARDANGALHDAGLLLVRPPVDADAWRAAEDRVSSALSAAESACSASSTDAEDQAMAEVHSALGTMRASLADFAEAARGSGAGINPAQRQEQIDAALDRARSLAGGRPGLH